VHQAFKGVGSNFRYRTTDPKNWENDDFKRVDAKSVQPGDLVLFNGHVGIVQSFNSATGAGEFMGSQTSTGPKVAKFTTNNPKVYWGNPNGKAVKGFYRFNELNRSASSSSSTSTQASMSPSQKGPGGISYENLKLTERAVVSGLVFSVENNLCNLVLSSEK
jgi:hypothetical protein